MCFHVLYYDYCYVQNIHVSPCVYKFVISMTLSPTVGQGGQFIIESDLYSVVQIARFSICMYYNGCINFSQMLLFKCQKRRTTRRQTSFHYKTTDFANAMKIVVRFTIFFN